MIPISVLQPAPGAGKLVSRAAVTAFADGTRLFVPPGWRAYFLLNGAWSGEYPPGSYNLTTGVSPFFRRLQTMMTGGVLPVQAQVWFVNLDAESLVQSSTGELLSSMDGGYLFHLSAELSLYLRVIDGRRLLQTVSGWDNLESETFEQYFSGVIRQTAQSRLSAALAGRQAAELSLLTGELSALLRNDLAAALAGYGVALSDLRMADLKPRPEEISLLQELRESRMRKKTELENMRDELNALYGGSMARRVVSEALLNSSRSGAAGAAAGIAAFPMAFSFGQQMSRSLLPQTRELEREACDFFGGGDHSTPPDRSEPPYEYSSRSSPVHWEGPSDWEPPSDSTRPSGPSKGGPPRVPGPSCPPKREPKKE